jgi:hypothetical protein
MIAVTWFAEHCDGRRYRLLVAKESDQIVGSAGTGQFSGQASL